MGEPKVPPTLTRWQTIETNMDCLDGSKTMLRDLPNEVGFDLSPSVPSGLPVKKMTGWKRVRVRSLTTVLLHSKRAVPLGWQCPKRNVPSKVDSPVDRDENELVCIEGDANA